MTNFGQAGDTILEKFFDALVTAVDADAGQQVSMYDIGDKLGLEKDASQSVAQDLMAEGVAEVRTLSGAIGLTAEGITKAGALGGNQPKSAALLDIRVDADGLLDETGCQAIAEFQHRLSEAMAESDLKGNAWQVAITNLKVVDLCLTSPQPCWSIMRESYLSMQAAAQKASRTPSPLIELLASALKGN